VGKVNYNDVSECSILPFEDAIPRASPMLLWTTLPLPLIYILRSLRSQAFLNGDSMAVPSPSQVSMCPSPDDSRLPFGDVQSCFVQSRITGAHLWSLPVFYVII
jgi:hypothetical protein